MRPSFCKLIKSPISTPFLICNKGVYNIVLPPVLDKLLLYAKGDTTGDSYRTDSYTILGDFPIIMSGSHCATFNGIDESVQLHEVAVSAGSHFTELSIDPWDETNRIIFSTGNWQESGWYIRTESATTLRILFNQNGTDSRTYINTGDIEAINSLNVIITHVTGINYDVTIEVNGVAVSESNHDMVNSTTNMVLGANTPQNANFFSGKIWNCVGPEEEFPLAEGSGTTVHSRNGIKTGTITTNNVNTFWSNTQDGYHNNAINGFWTIDGDTTKYPYPIVGFDEVNSPNTWNGAETLSSIPEDSLMIAADSLGTGPFFFDGIGNSIARTEQEMITHAETSDIFFFCVRDGNLEARHYNEVLSAQELIEAKGWCLYDYDVLIDDEGTPLMDDAGNIFVSKPI